MRLDTVLTWKTPLRLIPALLLCGAWALTSDRWALGASPCEQPLRTTLSALASGDAPVLVRDFSSALALEGITARQAQPEDAPAILGFIQKSRKELGVEALEAKRFKQGLDGDLRDIERLYHRNFGEFVVLRDGEGRVVGTAALARLTADTAELRKLYLSPELRGKGLGKRLLGLLIEEARKKGYSSVELETYTQMREAKKLYEASGFVRFESSRIHEPGVEAYRLEFGSGTAASRLEAADAKTAFFSQIADAIEARRDKILRILQRVDTPAGSQYELRQALDTLRHADTLELHNLQNTRRLKNVAVYGSTNIPLYTLIMHGVVPLSITDNVWFRTPAATRAVYRDLYQELSMALPPGALRGLNVLTEAKDVQYDNFRKMYVLGLNRKGKRLERAPSEVVLFTGSPETGRQSLAENARKLEEVAAPTEAYKQVFLGFGAGMNPMVVTGDARRNLDAAINATLESIRINCGQDCIAPNYYFVKRDVADSYVNGLLSRVGRMKPGRTRDPEAGYSSLTLSEDVKKLQDYRQKYEKYLVNPTATIDPVKKLVSPHVFVFPFSMFGEVALQEHFGPFITVFRYDSAADLKKMAMDPRVQKKAMYASVFGADAATPEVTQAVAILQQNRHGVSVNTSVYADESGNMPFGGAGSDASVVATLSKSPGRTPLVHQAHRPVLFSEEARLAYGNLLTQRDASTAPRSYFEKALHSLVDQAGLPPSRAPPMLYGGNGLDQPLSRNRPTGLKYIRGVIEREGLVRYLTGSRPGDPKVLQALEEFHGTKLVFESDLPKGQPGPTQGKGVVIHSTSPSEGPGRVNQYRGTVNPHLGRGNLQGLLDGRKLPEYQLAEAVQPGIMARTETFQHLQAAGRIGREFSQAREEAKRELAKLLARGKPLTQKERAELTQRISRMAALLFADVRKEFPSGAFFKNYDEFATADLGIQITSFGSNPDRLAGQFVRRFEAALQRTGDTGEYAASVFQKEMLAEDYETGPKFLNMLLAQPDDLLVQARVDIAKTEMGFNQEFRVDFMDGEAVYSKLRFSHEYMPEEAEQAKRVIDEFFKKAPPEFRHLSGGADVARLPDGRFVIIEFNFGSSSGTLMPRLFPVDSNEFITALQGKSTPFIQKLEGVFASGIEGQRAYLKSLKREKELWFKESFEDLSVAEVGKWLRNRYLQEWAKSPSRESAEETIKKLQSVFDGLATPGNEDLDNLIRGAKYYIERKLLGRGGVILNLQGLMVAYLGWFCYLSSVGALVCPWHETKGYHAQSSLRATEAKCRKNHEKMGGVCT